MHDTPHTSTGYYEPEASTNLFGELESAAGMLPCYERAYSAMERTFVKCLNQKTGDTSIILGGTFAKTDYLLKEHNATGRMAADINQTRVRIRRRHELSPGDLERYCLYDIKNLAQFVAFVYGAAIPQSLLALLPTTKTPAYGHQLVNERVRVIVYSWDDDYITAHADDDTTGQELRICYTQGNNIYDYDWTYLRKLLTAGTQLNLINIRQDGGITYPELIIYEPDYLVNISTVAHCFTNYADSPYVDLIKKLEPSQPTEPIVLGNLAGQLLDEEIHQLPNTRSYTDSIMDFYRSNALNLLTAGISQHFHDDARRQKANIARAIRETLPHDVSAFDSKDGITEPSFYSEMLGLQGRMDYLQMDMRVLLEQKSGKGRFPYDNFVTPRQTDEHYVQLLLYMLLIRYNYSQQYAKNGNKLSAFLLYSKYTDSLLGLGFAGELVFNALRVRNCLAWTELSYTKPDGYKILDRMTPAMLNIKGASNKLWHDYQSKQIAAVLGTIQGASQLEKAYFYRFMTFVANEHAMSKLGNKTKESSGFASTWHDSLDEKRLAGNIYDNLTLQYPDRTSTGRISTVTLRFAESDAHDMSNFRTGDIVMLYPYPDGSQPDARKTMVHRCSILSIMPDTITLKLRSPQADNRVFVKEEGKLWAIEHDFMESSYSPLYKGLYALLGAPKARRDLLLLQRGPETDPTVTLRGQYGTFDDLVLRVRRAKDLFLIIGPPGTGKTSFGLLYPVREQLLDAGTSVLLMSYTNRAVDEICSKLVADGIGFIRIGGTATCPAQYHPYLLSEIAGHSSKLSQLSDTIASCRVFVGTTSAMSSNMQLFKLKQFAMAIIDEASQILEPHLMGLLSATCDGVPAIGKIVLIGDQKQLPAVVQQGNATSRVDDPVLNAIHLTDCRLSLFERLLRRYAGNPDVTYMLTRQGRMHHDIAIFANHSFYNNKLVEVPLPHQQRQLPATGSGIHGIDDILATRRIAFVAVTAPDDDTSDKVNQNEADIIAAIVLRIYHTEKDRGFDPARTVGVIVPYRNQIATIRDTIDRHGIPVLHDITIDTVERYQGSQRKYIVYGFTIKQYYQLDFLSNNTYTDIDGSIVDRKLNVAMTRAEEHLVMVGNPALLSNNFTFYKLMQFVRSKHGYFDVGKDDFVSGNFAVPPCGTAGIDPGTVRYDTADEIGAALASIIDAPLRAASGQGWPARVLGNDADTNLNAIGYGRTSAAGPLADARLGALVYCHYYMRQQYSIMRAICSANKQWLAGLAASVAGRMHHIDLGCGPATCGLAMASTLSGSVPDMVYTGIDPSSEMRQIAAGMISQVTQDRLYHQLLESFDELGASFWQGVSELPSLIVVSMSNYFANITAQYAERLAMQLSAIMGRHPLNRYVIIIQQQPEDRGLNAYRVFRQLLTTKVKDAASTVSTVTCCDGAGNHSQPYACDIQVSY